MAKTRLPFSSWDAWGKLGDKLTFRRSRSGTIAEKTPQPKDTNTAAQQAQRSAFQDCVAQWHALTPAQKEAYRLLDPNSNYNAAYINFMAECLKGVPVADHNLLSATHPDTVAASPVEGDLIVGNATPKWARLAKGAAALVLKAGAATIAWGQVAFSEITGTITDAQTEGLYLKRLYQDMLSRSHTGDLLETTLNTYTLPANTLGTNKGIRIKLISQPAGGANNKTLRLYFGATALISWTETSNAEKWIELVLFNNTTATQRSMHILRRGGSTGEQILQAAAIDTTADVVIKTTGQLALATDIIYVQMFLIELIP